MSREIVTIHVEEHPGKPNLFLTMATAGVSLLMPENKRFEATVTCNDGTTASGTGSTRKKAIRSATSNLGLC